MPRTWRAGGIIGPTTAKQKMPVPEELKSLITEEVVAGGSSTKALDPCLETGEVGEGPSWTC